MKIAVTDKGSGVMAQFAQAIGTAFSGRFIYIPENKGSGYITGFGWGNDLKMMIRNYHLNEDVILERTNLLADGEENVGFFLSGVFPSPTNPEIPLVPEKASVLICMQTVSSVMDMPSNTYFGSIGIVVSRKFLRQYFGAIQHSVVETILEVKDNFLFETGISPEIIKTASEMLHQPVPESFESYYYKLKCEELLCYIFALLVQRDALPVTICILMILRPYMP
ncbi:hypothetical protein EV144_101390 [Flavobacterium sp. 270]|uniref:hypothetical protein n=1 Tax=Flavobacterium sp. 270 TaxID=2512114 RepID=UPI0010DB5597|nr:hypothetical protein [Flavobacterium sp. 270]TDW51714.1 hypothetical protein EV144_101390 [Flavobacterium sp. 270]